MPYDLQVNGLINGVDINDLKPVESNFRPFPGYEYYYIENDDVYTNDYIYNSIECKKLSIKHIPSTTINKLKTIKNKLNVFRIVLRKNEIIDESGAFMKDFYEGFLNSLCISSNTYLELVLVIIFSNEVRNSFFPMIIHHLNSIWKCIH